jgi:hypothetical protein
MEWQFLLGLGAITLVVIGLVIYLGLKLNRAVMKRAPETAFALSLTFTGTALMACIVGFWIICLVAGKLRPHSSFGAFVGTTDGAGMMIVGSIFFAGVAGAVLEKLGYPVAKNGERS